MNNSERICHFSCGATSAIATALTLEKYPEAEIIYADPGGEHPDNMRFLRDCEKKLFGKKITIIKSKKYETIFDVFRERRYLAGVAGAPCTFEMKKIPIREYLGARLLRGVNIFGFDASEMPRIDRYRNNNPEIEIATPLVDSRINKRECQQHLINSGIDLPAMYRLGYRNAKCIGCVKAANGPYWAAIREDFPAVFNWFAEFERTIGRKINGIPKGETINKRVKNGTTYRVFLDELEDKPNRAFEMFCGYSCGESTYN